MINFLVLEKAACLMGCRAVTILRGIANNANIGIVRDASLEFFQRNPGEKNKCANQMNAGLIEDGLK